MKIAMQFPGQGSQSLGMLAELAKTFPIVEQTFSRASQVLSYDLWALVQDGPADTLNQTEFTQPALLAADIAIWECWKEKGGADPVLAAGHSLGEYAALVAASAIPFEDAIACVALRGRLMQAAVPEGVGAMAAIIGLDSDVVAALCQDVAENEVVSSANFNSPSQIVISGHKAAVERAVLEAKNKGAKIAKLIPVSVPSHCVLMQPAVDRLSEKLDSVSIQAPKFPVIHNVDVSEHTTPKAIREALLQQLTQPVRWVDILFKMEKAGIQLFVECGPGHVLCGLDKRTFRRIPAESIYAPELMDSVLTRITQTIS